MRRSKGRLEELQVLCSAELSDQLQGLARLGLRGETGKLLQDHSARGESSHANHAPPATLMLLKNFMTLVCCDLCVSIIVLRRKEISVV